MYPKAEAGDFLGRFREIISDPLNLLIHRHPLAGTVDGNFVYLHNGHKVARSGAYAYYGSFSDILVINRGVHEPLEEYVFQELLKRMPTAPTMLELGAYWGHYSMWLKQARPAASVHLVEPEAENIKVGRYNFERHGYDGQFTQAFVGAGYFEVDTYLQQQSLERLDILHSDIQGFELEMLDASTQTLKHQRIDYVFISTHSQSLHIAVVNRLKSFNYRVEVSSDFATETTSFDGFIFASSPLKPALFEAFSPLGRVQILECTPTEITAALASATTAQPAQHSYAADI